MKTVKLIYAYLEKILVSLAVIAVISLLAMNQRIGAVENRLDTKDKHDDEMRSDIAAIRCYVSKDKLSCMKYEQGIKK